MRPFVHGYRLPVGLACTCDSSGMLLKPATLVGNVRRILGTLSPFVDETSSHQPLSVALCPQATPRACC